MIMFFRADTFIFFISFVAPTLIALETANKTSMAIIIRLIFVSA